MDAKKNEFDMDQIQTFVDHNGQTWICGLGVNDSGYQSAQHCWPAEDLVPGSAKEIL